MNFLELGAKLSLDSSDYERGLDRAKGLASKLGSGIGTAMKIGAAAIAAATTAAVAFGAASVKTGMEFDKSMSQVAATMGLTMDEMANKVGAVETSFGHFEGNLRDFAQFMGSNTAFSAIEAADALNYMALAGYDAQTSMEMLPNVLNLAAAGSMDLARASDMVTDTQTAFGISLERTSQMVDEMAKAASTGNTSVEQLGDAFLTVGGLAQELNGGFVTLKDGSTQAVDGIQEMEIMLTAMANAGIKGSEAGTHMRNMLLKLAKPTKDGAVQMDKLKLSVWDAEGNMRSMKDIMGDLNGALGELTQEEKIQAISDLFNTRDLASAEALLNAVEDDWDQIGEAILDADGAAAKMAETQLDNLAGDITLFKSALEGAKIVISDSLSPALREFVQFGTEGISRLTEAFKEGGMSGAMEEFGKLLSEGITMIFSDLPSMVEAGAGLLKSLGEGLLQNMPLLTSTAVEIITMMAGYLIEAAPDLIGAGLDILLALGNGIVENLPTIIPVVSDVIMEILNALVDNAPELLAGAVEIITTLANGLSENLPELIPAVVDMIMQIVETLTQPDTLSSLIDAAIAIIMALTDGLIEALPTLIERAPEIIGNLVDAIIENTPKLLEAAFQIIIAIVQGIVQNLPQILQSGREIVNKILSGISQLFSKLIEQGRAIVDKIGNGLKNAASKALQWGRELVQKVVSGISNAASSLINAGLDMVRGIWQGISNGYSWITSRISGWVGNVTSFFKRILGISSPSKVYRDQIGKWLARGIGVGFVNEMSAVEKMMAEAMPDPNGFVDSDTLFGSRYEYRTISDGDYSYANSRLDSELLNILRDIRDNIGTELYLDDGTLIGWIDQSLGRKAAQRIRGNA